MKEVKIDFKERCDEITAYFDFVKKVESRGSKITFLDETGVTFIEPIESNLVKTMKAQGFILLYNLTESSIKKAIEQIYVKMKREKVKYDKIKDGIKREIIIYLKTRKNADEFVNSVNAVAKDIIEQCFSSKFLFSGNVDAREIRKVADKYGFSTATDTTLTQNGRKLLTVKTQRNDLSHGIYSFQEVGKKFTVEDLMKIKDQVIAYLSQILDNIETYINNKDYLHRP